MAKLRSPRFLTYVVVITALFLAGCNSTTSPQANGRTSLLSPTGTPNVSLGELALQSAPFSMSVHGQSFNDVQGTQHGYVFQLQNFSDGHIPFVGKMYYYDYLSKRTTLIDTAQQNPPGDNRDIRLIAVAGDNVAYIKSDNSLESWEFWLANFQTGRRVLLDSPAQTPSQLYPSNFALDTHHVVWSSLVEQNGKFGSVMHVYTIATGTTATIMRDFASNPPNIYRPAIAGDTITYTKLPYGSKTETVETIWRMNIDGSGAQLLATTSTANVNIHMNATYVVWDEILEQGGTVHAFDLQTNSLVTLPKLQCVRPDVTGTFLTCEDIATTLYLVDLTSGKWSSVEQGDAPIISVTADRVIWAVEDLQKVEWVMLPTT